MNNESKNDIFWLEKPKILIDNYLNFIPNKYMSENQKYNSITLFCIYLIILILIFKGKTIIIYIPIAIIIICICMYYIKDNNLNYINETDEHFTEAVRNELTYNKGNFDNLNLNNNITEDPNIIYNKLSSDSENVEIGYYDSDDRLRFDRTTNQLHQNNMPDYDNANYECKKPTPDNPFMNIQYHDYDNAEKVVACNSDDEDINNEVIKSFNEKILMNSDDAFERTNGQRQFYTCPNTKIPNDQVEFAKWLYKAPQTCKENQEQCLRYEDLRFKRLV